MKNHAQESLEKFVASKPSDRAFDWTDADWQEFERLQKAANDEDERIRATAARLGYVVK